MNSLTGKRKRDDETDLGLEPKAESDSEPQPKAVVYLTYSPKSDISLRKGERKRGYFKQDPNAPEWVAKFRVESGPTISGKSTGLHEAFVTTDTFNFLREAKPDGTGKVKLGQPKNKNSIYMSTEDLLIDEEFVGKLMRMGDGFRSDTLQTIMSYGGNKFAGHTNSGVSQVGQAEAHDLLRKANIRLWNMNPKTEKGLTDRSLAVAMGGVVITSMAPAQVVGTKLDSLRAPVQGNYEVPRNQAKRILASVNRTHSRDEQQFAWNFVDQYMKDVGGDRKMGFEDMPSSPPRNEVGDGNYSIGAEEEPAVILYENAPMLFSFHFRWPKEEAPNPSLKVNPRYGLQYADAKDIARLTGNTSATVSPTKSTLNAPTASLSPPNPSSTIRTPSVTQMATGNLSEQEE